MNQFSEFIQWGFYSVLTGCAIYLTAILNGLKGSVDELNVKMATIIERVSHHEKRIEKLEDKIT